jgi:hypothetical protein
MSLTVDDFIEREKLFLGTKLNNKVKHEVRGRVFEHTFVNAADRTDVLGRNSSEFSAVQYTFLRDPNKKEIKYITEKLPKMDMEDVVMWIMWANEEKEIKAAYAKVENKLELGSKHGTIAQYIVEKDGNCALIAAGEIRRVNKYKYEFNYYSGTFMEIRMDMDKYETEDEEEFDKVKRINDDYVFVQKHMHKLNPFKSFTFNNVGYNVKKDLPFKLLKNYIDDEEEYPYILPIFKDKERNVQFSKSAEILSDFKNLDELKKILVRINTYAEYPNIETGAITTEEIDRYDYPMSLSKYIDLKKIATITNVYILPHNNDLNIAKSIFQTLGVVKYGHKGTRPGYNIINDFYGISGKQLSLWKKGKEYDLFVDDYLTTSNNTIYRATFEDKDVILKLHSLYPFGDLTGLVNFGKLDEKLYGIKIDKFIVPRLGAMAIVIPYLGKDITKLDLEFRKEHYKQFKKEYFEKYMKTISKNMFSKEPESYYNDVKPHNTTWDGEEFHLIDPDSFSFTPSWYGLETMETIESQLFGILLIYYWFANDINPFQEYSHDEFKIDWIKSLPEDSNVKKMFEMLFDPKLSSLDKIKKVAQFSRAEYDEALSKFDII